MVRGRLSSGARSTRTPSAVVCVLNGPEDAGLAAASAESGCYLILTGHGFERAWLGACVLRARELGAGSAIPDLRAYAGVQSTGP